MVSIFGNQFIQICVTTVSGSYFWKPVYLDLSHHCFCSAADNRAVFCWVYLRGCTWPSGSSSGQPCVYVSAMLGFDVLFLDVWLAYLSAKCAVISVNFSTWYRVCAWRSVAVNYMLAALQIGPGVGTFSRAKSEKKEMYYKSLNWGIGILIFLYHSFMKVRLFKGNHAIFDLITLLVALPYVIGRVTFCRWLLWLSSKLRSRSLWQLLKLDFFPSDQVILWYNAKLSSNTKVHTYQMFNDHCRFLQDHLYHVYYQHRWASVIAYTIYH